MDIEDILPIKKYMYTDEQVKLFVQDFINITNINNIDYEFKLLVRQHGIQPCKTQMRKVYETFYNYINIDSNLKRWMIKRVMRSDSGVIVVTLVTKPGDNIKFSCPEKCAYCPTETDLNGNPTQPKSYISTEPAMLRAIQSDFDIQKQIINRIRSYLHTGNIKKNDDKKKIEVILSGGTWDVMPKNYRDSVILDVYYTFNTIYDIEIKRPKLTLEEEKIINQTSIFRVIGLTIETRPDYITHKSIQEYLNYGVTRVQIGCQTIYDDILVTIKRGCTFKNIKNGIKLLKQYGFKVVAHWMPDLPTSSPDKDIHMFNIINNDPLLQTDDIKIYPFALIKSASNDRVVKIDLEESYKNGKYFLYSEKNIDDLINVLINFKKNINPWVRIERLIRDFPTQSIDKGYNKITNLRQLIKNKMTKQHLYCKCIRCMEIKDNYNLINYGKLVVRKYNASDGIEYHISFEVEKYYWHFSYIIFWILYFINAFLFGKTIYYSGNKQLYQHLFGFLRLRIEPNLPIEELKDCGLIREVHVYGQSIEVGNINDLSTQHKGIGKLLVKTAEDIIKSHNLLYAAVIAGVGAREYYKNKCGYNLDKYYMKKYLF